MNLAPAPDAWPFSLEKRYLDVLAADGTVLVVYLARLRLCGVPVARVTAELFRPGCAVVRGSAKARRVSGGENFLDLGPGRIDAQCVRWETPSLSGELTYVRRQEPFSPRTPLLEVSGRRLEWTVEVPDADVEGRLVWPGGELELAGRGYRDRVWFDLPPWRFPLKTLDWGRAVAGPHAATWILAQGTDLRIESRWLDGRCVASGEQVAELGQSRTLVDGAVLNQEVLQLGALRGILRRLSGDPTQTRCAATASIDGQPGVAVHERVTWR